MDSKVLLSGSVFVSSCQWLLSVSAVHPVAILSD